MFHNSVCKFEAKHYKPHKQFQIHSQTLYIREYWKAPVVLKEKGGILVNTFQSEWSHRVNTHGQHIRSTHTVNIRSTHTVNTYGQHIMVNTHGQHIRSTRTVNTYGQHTRSTHYLKAQTMLTEQIQQLTCVIYRGVHTNLKACLLVGC